MEMVVLNENQEELGRFNFTKGSKNFKFKKQKNVPDIGDGQKKLLNTLDYEIGVYSPNENEDNFYISFLNNPTLKSYDYNMEDIKNRYVSDIFLTNDKQNLILKIFQEVYHTNINQNVYFEYYNNTILQRRLKVTFTKIDNFIYIVAKNETYYDYLTIEQENIFENDFNAIAIVQNDHFVKVNKKYLEVYNKNSVDEVIGQKVGYTGLDETTIKRLTNNLNEIIEGKKFSYSIPLEIEKDGELIHYFIVNGNYVLYNGKPAIMAIHYDFIEQEKTRRELEQKTKEALTLEYNLNFIQSVSNTGITYVMNNKYIRSSEFYKIIERTPKKEDSTRHILKDITIDEDKHIIKEHYKKLGPEKDFTEFIIRILTNKGNLKYIHCYMRVNYTKGKKDNLVIFYQDVTEEQLYLKKLQKALEESMQLQNNLEKIQKISKTAIAYSEHNANSTWSSEIFDILEIDPKDYKNNRNNLIENFIINKDLETRKNHINSLSPTKPDTQFIQQIITGKNNQKFIKTSMHRDYDKNNNLIDCISFNQDITNEIEYQNQLETALSEKKILLSEVHHRVKNNLQVILSLINLNKNYEANPETILNNTENRIYAMALIHEKIYGSSSLSEVDIKDYIECLVESLLDMYWSNIEFHSDIESIDLDMEESIPIGLIINELVINTIKYAFPNDNEGNIYVEFKEIDNRYRLIYQDDGIGLPDDFDLNNLESLGLIVVKNLTTQLSGNLSIINCNGAGFKIELEKI